MRYREDGHFAITKHNFYTGESDSKIDVVKGLEKAQIICGRRNLLMHKRESEEGWAYSLKPTSLPVTLKPKRRRMLKPDARRKRL